MRVGTLRKKMQQKQIYKMVEETSGEGMRSMANELSNKMKDNEEVAMNETSEQLLQLFIKII